MKTFSELNISEASKIEAEKVPPKQLTVIKKLGKILTQVNSTPGQFDIFYGIHGYVVWFPHSLAGGTYRFNSKEIKGIAKLDIRWIEGTAKNVSVGL